MKYNEYIEDIKDIKETDRTCIKDWNYIRDIKVNEYIGHGKHKKDTSLANISRISRKENTSNNG